MTNVSALTSNTNSGTGTLSTIGNANQASESLSGDLDNFLNLLVAQLKNQDPLSPMDSTEFTNQLVQFANVEQNIATNKNLENLLILNNNSLAVGAMTYLDHTIQAESSYLPLQDGYSKFSYYLPSDASKCTITITGLDDKVITTVKGDLTKGRHVLDWDGTDASGKKWEDGSYKIKISANSTDGKEMKDIYTTVFGKVTGVANDGTDVAVSLGKVVISVAKILAVHEDSELENPNKPKEEAGNGETDNTGTGTDTEDNTVAKTEEV
ncbi:MAG: Basal-body rod modification protein FlgD [Alphaproteobacteria bacterium ADurb.Bin438]|nr:MAG: Basal-body rod modification protein FlgD [Alphaproteobacteria bacterium ADurb.Bin438]